MALDTTNTSKPNQSKETSKQVEIISNSKLLEAGTYFGHKKDRWNPKMKPYIVMTKKGTHIIDIKKTKKALEFAYSLIEKLTAKGASFIFVGTRKQAKETIKYNALRTNSHYVSERWLGGTLTNFKTIFERVKYMQNLERKAETDWSGYTKKEGLKFAKELQKLQKNLIGIQNMRSRPAIMIIADPQHDKIAVKEAKKSGIKVIGITDTNSDPSFVDLAIPANDDSIKSVTLIITILADAISKVKGGQQLFAYQNDDLVVLPEDKREKSDSHQHNFKRRSSNLKKPRSKSRS